MKRMWFLSVVLLFLLGAVFYGCSKKTEYQPGTAESMLPSVNNLIDKAESAKIASQKLDGEVGVLVQSALDRVIEEALELQKSALQTSEHVLALEAKVAELQDIIDELTAKSSDAVWLKWFQRVSLVAVVVILGAGVIFRSGAIATVSIIPGLGWFLSHVVAFITPWLPLIIGISVAAGGIILAIRYRSYLFKSLLTIEHIKPAIPEQDDTRLFGATGQTGEIGKIQGSELTRWVRRTKAKLKLAGM